MQWTQPGTHVWRQTRTHVLNDDLEDIFREWYRHFSSASHTFSALERYQSPEQDAAYVKGTQEEKEPRALLILQTRTCDLIGH